MTDFAFVTGQALIPTFAVAIEGKDVTTSLAERLISLTHTDNRDFEADQLDLELDDAEGLLELPRRGAVLSLSIGWKGRPLIQKGKFTVDEIEHAGTPDRLTIRARSADFRETLNIKRERSWHDTTIGAIAREIASRHKLGYAIGQDMQSIALDHIDQTNESDSSFLARLAKQYGAMATVKNGNLLFIRKGQGKTASGRPLPVIVINRDAGDQHRFSLADRGAYTGVVASWLNLREPKKKGVIKVRRRRKKQIQPTKIPDPKQGDYLVGSEENVLVLSRTYANKANAERAAKSNWERIQRGAASFSIQLAKGREDLFPEMPVKVSGFKPQIDAAEWIITTVTNTISDGGFTTSIELEVKIDEFEME